MNKKNLIRGILAVAGVAGLAFYLRKQYKKVSDKVKEEEQSSDKELEELGVSSDKLNEECKEGYENLVKALAAGTMFNPNWDIDIIDPQRAMDAENILSVIQEGDHIAFIFDIPNYVNGGFKSPKLGDYLTSFKTMTKKIWEEHAKFCPSPRCKMVGMISVYYQENGKDRSERVEIDDKSIYEELADDVHDGLSAFYEKMLKRQLPQSVADRLQVWVDNRWGCHENVKVVEISLVYKASFKIQDDRGVGITLKGALEALDAYVNDLSIEGRNGGKEVTYENVLFCAPNPNGEFDMTYYYDEEDGRLIVDNYTFEV